MVNKEFTVLDDLEIGFVNPEGDYDKMFVEDGKLFHVFGRDDKREISEIYAILGPIPWYSAERDMIAKVELGSSVPYGVTSYRLFAEPVDDPRKSVEIKVREIPSASYLRRINS